METGVHGKAGIHVQWRVVMEQGHDLEYVIIHHLQMVDYIAQGRSMQ